MEAQHLNKGSFLSNSTWRRWLIAVGIVWMVLALIYAFLAIHVRKKQRVLNESGLTMIEAFSEKAGLPLLEQNIKQLREMLIDFGKKPDVLYATVVDHKNKIIAYTDAGRLLPPRKAGVSNDSGIETWMDEDAMIFSKDILFSGTPIGEIRLAFTRASIVRAKSAFAIITIVSLAGLVLAWLLIHGRGLIEWVKRRRGNACATMDDSRLHCPLCGQDVEGSHSFCHAVHDNEKNIVFRMSGAFSGKNASSGLQLSEIGSNPDLASIKGQMIRQCADIISKLSVNDGRSSNPAGENIG